MQLTKRTTATKRGEAVLDPVKMASEVVDHISWEISQTHRGTEAKGTGQRQKGNNEATVCASQ